MQWMFEWPGAFPLFAKEARGARITDVASNEYLDFCLGDTGSMFGHSPEPVATALADQARCGFTYMLPTGDSIRGAEILRERFGLPWYVTQIGARVEYRFQPAPPRNGTEALEGVDRRLDRLIHRFFLNRGILVTPFHNMLLISPETTMEDVDRHTAIFAECAGDLTRRAA